MSRHGLRAQRDLFAVMQATGRLAPETRQVLLLLLETLLREVVAVESVDREGGDEQDHA
jgi:hypothetical protein